MRSTLSFFFLTPTDDCFFPALLRGGGRKCDEDDEDDEDDKDEDDDDDDAKLGPCINVRQRHNNSSQSFSISHLTSHSQSPTLNLPFSIFKQHSFLPII